MSGIGRIIEWYVTVLCRFARNVGAVSELMAAGQMFRGFSAELSCPRAQHNAPTVATCTSPMSVHVHARRCDRMVPLVYECRDRVRVYMRHRNRFSGNIYITCTVVGTFGYKYRYNARFYLELSVSKVRVLIKLRNIGKFE